MAKKNETNKDAIVRRLEGIRESVTDFIDRKFDNLCNDITECEECGDVTVGDRGRKQFCSDICRVNNWNRTKKQ